MAGGGSGGSGSSGGNGGEESSSLSSEDGEQREMVLDFSEIFRSSHVPMAVVSIDGRILQCNDEFSRATGKGSLDTRYSIHTQRTYIGEPETHTTRHTNTHPRHPTRHPADISNDKLSGATLFSLAAPEALEELFKSIARLLSTAALDRRSPAYFATAAAKAAPFAHPVRAGRFVLQRLYGLGFLLLARTADINTNTDTTRQQPRNHAAQGYEGASILMSLVRDDERRARAFHCCIVPPPPGPGSSNGGLGRSSSASSVSSGGGQGDAMADDGSIMS